MSSRVSLTQRGLDAAIAYLERVGMTIAEKSWRSDAGPIEVIALDGDTLVFVNVETRKTAGGRPDTTELSASSRRRLTKIVEDYVHQHDLQDVPWRCDRVDLLVVSADRALLRHTRDVFRKDD